MRGLIRERTCLAGNEVVTEVVTAVDTDVCKEEDTTPEVTLNKFDDVCLGTEMPVRAVDDD